MSKGSFRYDNKYSTLQKRVRWKVKPSSSGLNEEAGRAPSQLIQWWGWQALVAGFLFRTFPQ